MIGADLMAPVKLLSSSAGALGFDDDHSECKLSNPPAPAAQTSLCLRRLPFWSSAAKSWQKNDSADAEAICEAVTRANMRFVATKTPGVGIVVDNQNLPDVCHRFLTQKRPE